MTHGWGVCRFSGQRMNAGFPATVIVSPGMFALSSANATDEQMQATSKAMAHFNGETPKAGE
jgi:hypothetical protein